MARNGNAKTRRFALNMLKVSVAISGAALLFACGDDDSSFVASENGGSAAEADIVVTIFDDLPNCTGKREGVTAYVKDEKTAYVCSDGDWVVAGETGDEGDDDGEKSSSSTAKSADSKGKSSSSDKDVSSSSVSQSSSSSVTLSEVEGSSSSSVIPGSDPESSSSDKEVSSSSVTQSSSSSVTLSEVEGSSSSSVIPGSDPESSSSEGVGDASSSSVIASSSSEELVSSSSFNKSSSSSRGLFEMSKDEFLNPKITYGTMTDTRDNKTYKTVKIGTQVWMAENLNYDYNKGTARSYCYRDIETNCDVTGRLYTWAAAIDSVALANDADNPQTCGDGKTCTLPTVVQGVCPEGWHLPSNDEWRTLFTAVGGSSKAGTPLKSQTGWKSQTGDAADRDAYGFSALPAGGWYDDSDTFHFAGYDAYFWSASVFVTAFFSPTESSYYAYIMNLYYDHEDAVLCSYYKSLGFSVRCLQN